MSEQAPPPPPLPPAFPPPPEPKGRGLGWFFVILSALFLVPTVGCILAVTEGDIGRDAGLVFMCASPTLALGGLFLWLGSRRLKR
jgi:hypothetical protein